MTANALDPITLGVIQNGFQQICNEMDLTFVRSAFSPVITEGQDRADGIYHCDTGELIAQGDFGLPIFVGTMQETTQSVIARAKTIEDGDIFAVNDPYLGGTHLMDVKFVKPFFYRGHLLRGSPTPATGPTSAARCRAATRRARRRSSKKA